MEMIDVSPFAIRVTGPAEGQHPGIRLIRLPKGRTIAGRNLAVDVYIAERFAAQRHFVLDWDDQLERHPLSVWGINGLILNGTFLPQGTERRPLSVGDELRIGGVSLRHESVSETPDIAG
ncbi:MAG TPA: FHA domain-containing protein [Blastocatellia bacterium]